MTSLWRWVAQSRADTVRGGSTMQADMLDIHFSCWKEANAAAIWRMMACWTADVQLTDGSQQQTYIAAPAIPVTGRAGKLLATAVVQLSADAYGWKACKCTYQHI